MDWDTRVAARQAETRARAKAEGCVINQGWYWYCAPCGTDDAGFVSEDAALASAARHIENVHG